MATEILTAVVITPYNVNSPTLDPEQQERYRGSALLHQIGMSFLFAIFLVVASLKLHHMPNTRQLAGLLGLLSFLIVVLLLKEFGRRMFFAHLEMLSAVATDLAACALQLSLIAAMSLKQTLSARNSYLAIGFASLIPACTWLYANRRRLAVSRSLAIIDFRMNWKIARWILGSGALWVVAMYVYPWLLIWMHGPSTTGAWAACYGLVALCNPVLLGFGNYLGPKIPLLYGVHGPETMRSYVWRSSIAFVLLLAPLGGVAWFFGNSLVGHLYGPAFTGYTAAIRLLIVNATILGAVFPISRGLFSMHRADLDMLANVVAVLILFLLGVPLVRSFGVTGAAIGLAASNGVSALIRAVVFACAVQNAVRTTANAKVCGMVSEA